MHEYGGMNKVVFDEQRHTADLIVIVIMKIQLMIRKKDEFLRTFREHFSTFCHRYINFEELKWRANQFNLVATMLEQSHLAAQYTQDNWSDHSTLQMFPGYYFMRAMP